MNVNWYHHYEKKYEVSQINKNIFSGICDNIGEPRDMILSEIKQNTGIQIPCYCTFMRNLKILNTKKQNRENKMIVTKIWEMGWVDGNGEMLVKGYKLSVVRWRSNGDDS